MSIACCFVACPSSTKSSTIIQWRPELDKFDMKNVMKTKKSSFIYVRMFAILIHRIGIACTLYETRYPTIRTKKTNVQIVCIHPSAQLIESAKKDFSVYFHPISTLSCSSSICHARKCNWKKIYTMNWIAILSLLAEWTHCIHTIYHRMIIAVLIHIFSAWRTVLFALIHDIRCQTTHII